MENSLHTLEKRWSILPWKDQNVTRIPRIEKRDPFESILSHLPLPILLLDPSLKIVYANRRLLEDFEETPALKGSLLSLISNRIRGCLKDEGFRIEGDLKCRSEGKSRIYHCRAITLAGTDPRDPHLLVLLDEITERVSLKRTLLQERKRLKEVFEGMGVGLVILKEDLRIERLNKSAHAILGNSSMRKLPRELYPIQVALTFTTGTPASISNHPVEWNGSRRIFEIHSYPLKDRKGRVVRIIESLRDVTEERKREENLKNVENLASAGKIAAGLAHELGNPLGVIAGTAQFCLQDRKVYNGIRKSFEVILRNAQNADRVIRELLHYTRPSESLFVETQLPLLVKRACFLIDAEIKKKRIQIEESHSPRLPSIRGDEHQLVQVFVNLLLNSIIACKQGGKIAIQTHQGEGGEKVSIEILDDGPGFPEEYLERAFDPFFTTRPGGTGLGLSISKKIILSHGGTIEISNRNGKGAKVTITLPVK